MTIESVVKVQYWIEKLIKSALYKSNPGMKLKKAEINVVFMIRISTYAHKFHFCNDKNLGYSTKMKISILK